MMKRYIHVFLIQKYIKDMLKCPFLHQLYTIRYKYINVLYIYIYIYIYIYLYMYVYIHKYIHTHIYTHIHTYTHTYIDI